MITYIPNINSKSDWLFYQSHYSEAGIIEGKVTIFNDVPLFRRGERLALDNGYSLEW